MWALDSDQSRNDKWKIPVTCHLRSGVYQRSRNLFMLITTLARRDTHSVSPHSGRKEPLFILQFFQRLSIKRITPRFQLRNPCLALDTVFFIQLIFLGPFYEELKIFDSPGIMPC